MCLSVAFLQLLASVNYVADFVRLFYFREIIRRAILPEFCTPLRLLIVLLKLTAGKLQQPARSGKLA